jgi:hypothetical protein
MEKTKIDKLRELITESLRVQKGGGELIDYIDVSDALQSVSSRQNHTIFARRGCGKTLLMHASERFIKSDMRIIYLNCEDFKRHTFPNVLVEILISVFSEIEKNLKGWFGRKKILKVTVSNILIKLKKMIDEPDSQSSEIKQGISISNDDSASAGVKVFNTASTGVDYSVKTKEDIEKKYNLYKEKLQNLDLWLPELKREIRNFFEISNNVKCAILQVDDLYHLKRTDQAFVVDYIHRLCKDIPLYFKIATLRHASTLYVDRGGQPIGAQERHDYQPINIDYNFSDFNRTKKQNWLILLEYAKKAKIIESELNTLFKGAGFERLVMAGGGVPRDVLSLFLELLSDSDGEAIGKDEVRQISLRNLERRIGELKQDSQGEEQEGLIRGIYAIREFCLSKKTNIFLVSEQVLQKHNGILIMLNRLLDYRIIHEASTALTRKSSSGGTYRAYAIDIGCYANMRKTTGKFSEIDITAKDSKDKMRSAPILDVSDTDKFLTNSPENISEVEAALTLK